MIAVQGVHVVFNHGTPLENRALGGIDLNIPHGQFITVIGSNGAGKSTLLNILSGEARCFKGSVHLDEKDITQWPVQQRARYIARVFQDPLKGTCEDLTIEENLSLAQMRTERRSLRPAVKQRFKAIFREKIASLNLGLENRLKDKVGLLSGGQRQAVSLLMASLSSMKLLLLDEHTAALDPKTASFILELTREIVSEQQLTVLMVTHSMKQALSMGDRTIMLHQGKMVLDIEGDERRHMTTQKLLEQFEKRFGEVDSDTLLLD